ncbi:MAG: GerMN domain-containing protein [Brevinematia bacterium]
MKKAKRSGKGRKGKIKTRDYSRVLRGLTVLLLLITIGSVIYIFYDIFREDIDRSIQKLFGLEGIAKVVSTSEEVFTFTNGFSSTCEHAEPEVSNIGDNQRVFSKKIESSNLVDPSSFRRDEKRKNVVNFGDQKDRSKLRLEHKKVFFYRISGEDLVFTSKEVEVEGGLHEIFRSLRDFKVYGGEVSFVNPKVSLLDYKVVDNTLLINLSREVEQNEYGGEGVLYSIYQIAYSLGSSVGVRKVLVLIEGVKPSYIGGEGIVFQNPIDITRDPFLK